MQIIVNHLTRMQKGFICVAGLEVPTLRHIRPVLAGARLSSSLLACHGGAFELGAILDLGQITCIGQRPELEDHRFTPRMTKKVGMCSAAQFWSDVHSIAKTKLADLFGQDLAMRGSLSCGVDLGKGISSLGCLVPASPIILFGVSGGGRPPRLRAEISDGQFHLELSVTDIRLHGSDHVTLDHAKVAWLEPLLQDPAKVVVSVGLSRPYAIKPGAPKLHWLQINNIHPLQAPLWS